SRRRHTRSDRDWSSDVCSSDLQVKVLTAPFPSRAARSCGSCWSKQPRSRYAACRNGAVSTFTWRCAEGGRLPRWRWRGDSPLVRSEERRVGKECRGGGGRDEEE